MFDILGREQLELKYLAQYLCEITLIETQISSLFSNSLICSSAICLAIKLLKPFKNTKIKFHWDKSNLAKITGFKKGDMNACADMLMVLLRGI